MPARGAARLRALAEAQRGRFALWLPVGLAAGVALYFALPAEPARGTALAWPLLAATALALARRHAVPRALAALALAAGLGFAAALWQTARAPPPEPVPARAVLLEGRAADVSVLADGRQRVGLAAPRLNGADPLARALRLHLRADDPLRVNPGARLAARVLIRPPPPPARPGGWDFQREAFFAGRAGTATSLGPARLLAAADGASWLADLRAHIARRFLAGLPGAEGAVAAALVTGQTAAIPRPDIAAFRESGLAHLLAVSGLHVSIVAGLVFVLVRAGLALSEHAALHWPCKQIAALAGLAAAMAYTPLAGSQVPMLRALAMAGLVVLGVLLGRRAITLRALGLAAAAILLTNPAALMGPSFQMSFAAVLALIAGHEAMHARLLAWRGEGGAGRRAALRLAGLVLTSLLAGLATLPVGMYHFGRAQLWFVAANLLAVPLTALCVMPCALLSLLLMPFGAETLAMAPLGWSLAALLAIARFVASWPAASLAVPAMPAWGLALFALGLCWTCLWRGWPRALGLPAIALAAATPFLARPADLLISADARLLALRTPHGILAEAGRGASRLIRADWEQYWAAPVSGTRLPDSAPGWLACDGASCRLGPRGAVLLLRRGESVPENGCAGTDLVIALEPLREGCPGVPKLDRFSFWREGAHAVWLAGPGPPVVVSDRALRGARPWVDLPPRRRPEEPPAAEE